MIVVPQCPLLECGFDRCRERPFRMEFRVDTRPCAESILKRCPGVDPDTCACIRNVTIGEEGWPEQKFTCEDFNGGPPPVGTAGTFWVEATPEKDTSVLYFAGPIEVPGGLFNATGVNADGTVEANIYLNLYTYDEASNGTGTLLQTVNFHSSCSQQLYLLDVFGSFQLVEFESITQGVVGFGISPLVGFSLDLETSADAAATLDFMTVVVLSVTTEWFPPQVIEFDVTGTAIPPALNEIAQVTLIPNQDFSVITTIGGDINGTGGCYEVMETVINCPSTVEPTLEF